MKKIGYLGNVEVSIGIVIGAALVIDKYDYRGTDIHLVLPFISFSYTIKKKGEQHV